MKLELKFLPLVELVKIIYKNKEHYLTLEDYEYICFKLEERFQKNNLIFTQKEYEKKVKEELIKYLESEIENEKC